MASRAAHIRTVIHIKFNKCIVLSVKYKIANLDNLKRNCLINFEYKYHS